ncbi:hypothetical protein QOZ89_35615 [Pseudofrankia sp. BMG5.37]|nr:hypothetical protein [Pseudofrankia sp. BMG5.37]
MRDEQAFEGFVGTPADAGWGGIRIGWLPAGTTRLGDGGGPNGRGIGDQTGQPGAGVAYTGHQDAIYVSSFTQAGERDSLLRIVVSWHPQEDFAASHLLEGGTPITVHSQPGRRYNGGLTSQPGGRPHYRAGLTWREGSAGPVAAVTAQSAARWIPRPCCGSRRTSRWSPSLARSRRPQRHRSRRCSPAGAVRDRRGHPHRSGSCRHDVS